MKEFKLLVILVMGLCCVKCGAIDQATRKTYPSNVIKTARGTFTVVNSTGTFGTDSNDGIYEPDICNADPVIDLRTTTHYERHFDSHKSKCGSPKQARDFYYENEYKDIETNQQVLNPAANQGQPVILRSGNPSAGNEALKAFIEAAGFVGGNAVRRPDKINVQGGKAIAEGGDASAKADANADSHSEANAKNETHVDTNVGVNVKY